MIIRRALCLSLCLFAASIYVSAQCPRIAVSSQTDVQDGQPITFTANVSNLSRNVTPTFNWTVSAGTISSGQGTSSITVDTAGIGGQTVTATVELGGVAPECSRTASCSTSVMVEEVINPTKFDEYGDIRFNDEKARLEPELRQRARALMSNAKARQRLINQAVEISRRKSRKSHQGRD